MSEEIKNKLKSIEIEDYIWIIYLGIIFMSWYANSLERDFYLHNNPISKKYYREIMIGIFSILLIVYLYFLYSAYQDLKNLKQSDTPKRKELVTLSFIASLLLVISGIIFLYISFKDNELYVELAFN